MIIVTGFVTVRPTDLSDFAIELAELGRSTRLRTGCLDYSAALKDARTGRWLVVERWEDRPALKAHIASSVATWFVDRWGHRMMPDVRMYDVTGESASTDDL